MKTLVCVLLKNTPFIEAFVGLQVSSDAQTGTVRIILKNDQLLSSRER